MPTQIVINPYTITTGATKSYSLTEHVDIYEIKANGGATTLSSPMVFQAAAGTPKTGTYFKFNYGGGVTTSGANVVSFFGTALTNEQALIKSIIECYYNGSAWVVIVSPSLEYTAGAHINTNHLVNLAVTGATMANATVTASKLAVLTGRGYIYRSGASGVLEEHLAKTAGYLLGGDGTDVKSLQVDGDITFTYSGGKLQASIGAGKVTNSMLANPPADSSIFKIKRAFSSAEILTLNSSPIEVIPAPGVGYAILVLSACMNYNHNTTSYSGNMVRLILDTAVGPQFVDGSRLTYSSADRLVPFNDNLDSADLLLIENKALLLDVETADLTAGDGTFDLHVTYQVIQL